MYNVTIINQNEYSLPDVVKAWPHSGKVDILNVRPQSMRIRTSNCPNGFEFGIDHLKRRCSAPMPYVTGIYSLPHWESANSRRHMLTFIGSTWRASTSRTYLVKQLQNTGRVHLPLVIRSHNEEAHYGWASGNISRFAKSQYGMSTFSMHPRGDTWTRRSFYESLLLGCIPIVEEVAYKEKDHYSNVLPGVPTPFIISLNADTFYNATRLLAYLDSIPTKRIEILQQHMRQVATYYTYAFDRPSFWDVVVSTSNNTPFM